MTAVPLLHFEDVALVLGGRRAIDRISFAIGPGERIAIVGASGSGKSLILRLALGLHRATSGLVQLFGADLAEADEDWLRLKRARCGVALQGGSLLGEYSVEDNLWLAFGGLAPRRERLKRRIERMLLEFELEAVADQPVRAVSVGERRRAELARAFLRDPELVILDDPFDGAHGAAAALEARTTRQIVPRGRALLLLTQDEDLAHRLAPRVLRLEQGRII